MFGRAQVANPSVRVLPAISSLVNPLVSAGIVNSKANCPNDGSDPSASASATSVSLLGGLVALTVVDGDVASLSVNNVSYGTDRQPADAERRRSDRSAHTAARP